MIINKYILLEFERNNKLIKINYIIYFKYIIILFILIFNFYLVSNKNIYFSNKINNIINKNARINYNNINLNNSLYESAKNAINFIDMCNNGLLLRKKSLNLKNNNTLISAVIPVYNCQKTIIRAIRSIQNQNINELEIILVNDYSLDNTSIIIHELKKTDTRIKIINNKKNMGILFTRCIGTLYARGKYIFPLDNDDMVLNDDIFSVLYRESKNSSIDIILFKTIFVVTLKDFYNNRHLLEHRGYKKSFNLTQPKLGEYAMKSVVLWGKCIKAELYKKAINSLGIKKYSNYMIIYEDTIINYIIHQLAKTSNFILKFGILHLNSPKTASRLVKPIKRCFYFLFFIEVLFEYSRNTIKGKLIVVSKINNLFNKAYFQKILKNKNFRNKFKLLLKKILSSKYISESNKKFINKKCQEFNFSITS